jgi:hypothetical protein
MKTAFVKDVLRDVIEKTGEDRDLALARIKWNVAEGIGGLEVRFNPKDPKNFEGALLYFCSPEEVSKKYGITEAEMKAVESLIASIDEDEMGDEE